MKHSFLVTLILVSIFFFAQVLGLVIVRQYVDLTASAQQGETVIDEAAYLQTGIAPPHIEEKSYSFLYILGAVLLGTILILLVIKFRQVMIWKLWFFLSVVLTLLMAFSPFIDTFLSKVGFGMYAFSVTIIFALILAYLKVYKPNIYIHNFTELFIYGGLVTIIFPLFNLFSITILLILISLYDMYAVWKSKHMITMATFQKQTMLFAGLLIPYHDASLSAQKKIVSKSSSTSAIGEKKVRTAILGGGDIAFPLLFSATVYAVPHNFIVPFVITIFTSLALLLLYVFADKNKYYPAMPFLSLGCFLGYSVTWLFGLI